MLKPACFSHSRLWSFELRTKTRVLIAVRLWFTAFIFASISATSLPLSLCKRSSEISLGARERCFNRGGGAINEDDFGSSIASTGLIKGCLYDNFWFYS